jgi:restriction system protein
MLGRASVHASECFEQGFIGADFDIREDLTFRLPDQWKDFNREFVPIVMATDPEKSKIGAGLSCGSLWTVCKGIAKGDLVLCPDGAGTYQVGRVIGDYYYVPEGNLPHRRKVEWLDAPIQRSLMSQAFKASSGSIGTVANVSQYAEEIEQLMRVSVDLRPRLTVVPEEDVEAFSEFMMEEHLESFLEKNWDQTLLGRDYMIYAEGGENIGRQYRTEAGIIDILAQSRDGKRLLVVELKRGRTSDVVVGQTLRYMGYVQEELTTEGQTVEGAIIALEEDRNLLRALTQTPAIKFYRYKIDFSLIPVD